MTNRAATVRHEPVVGAQDVERRIAREVGLALHGLEAARPLITVFGSARVAPESESYQLARGVAAALGRAGFGIITGGGPGIMAAANRGAREVGTPSLGASIVLPQEQASNAYLDREVRFEFFFTRKLALLRTSCGYLCFPGGFGTVDELFEALVLIQTDKLPHFPIVLFGSAYWRGVVDWMTWTLVEAGAIEARDRGLLVVTDDPHVAVAHFQACHERLCATLGPGPHYPAAHPRQPEATHGDE